MKGSGKAFKAFANLVLPVASVTVGTGLLWLLHPSLGKAHVGLVYLLLVAGMAAIGGLSAAIITALLSFLAWNFFFLPPFHTLVVEDPRDWILLAVFLTIATLIGQITGRLKDREAEAIAREQHTNALYRASLAVNSQISLERMLPVLTEQVIQATRAKGCAILTRLPKEPPLTPLAASGEVEDLNRESSFELAQWAIRNAKAVGLQITPEAVEAERAWIISRSVEEIMPHCANPGIYLPLILSERAAGILIVFPSPQSPFSNSEYRMLVAFANLAAATIERQNLIDEATQAAAEKETERLKSTLFSSLSHNLKTPLASLSATVGALRQKASPEEKPLFLDSLNAIAEDVDRLTEHINNLLNLAQLEAGNWQPEYEWFELSDIVSMAVARLSEQSYRRIQVQLPPDLPLVRVDSVQMTQVIRHLIENALDYSPMGSSVIVGGDSQNHTLRFWVDDRGAGVPESEREKIFRKFYRGSEAIQKSVRGTGLGLSICKEIVQAHGGSISVRDAPTGGARFLVELPLPQTSQKAVEA